jgi:large subunit ribosomal protein L18
MINQQTAIRRLRRVRGKVLASSSLPRLSVFRSYRHIYAQIIDDQANKTIVACSTKTKQVRLSGNKSQQAATVGLQIAKLSLAKKIRRVKFDRGAYRYHGRVKALAQGARKGGLKF